MIVGQRQGVDRAGEGGTRYGRTGPAPRVQQSLDGAPCGDDQFLLTVPIPGKAGVAFAACGETRWRPVHFPACAKGQFVLYDQHSVGQFLVLIH